MHFIVLFRILRKVNSSSVLFQALLIVAASEGGVLVT